MLSIIKHSYAEKGDYLLPNSVVPSHYDLKLVYDVDPSTNFSYFGVVDISVTCKEATSKIVLHAEQLSIDETKSKITSEDEQLSIKSIQMSKEFNFLTVQLDRELTVNNSYVLELSFYGNLKKQLDGVYISTYADKISAKTEYLIATQFEAISARKGFPCFDEPSFKSTFTVNIGHHVDFTAISNMPLHNSSQENSLETIWSWNEIERKFNKDKSLFVWDQFATSVPMSTYLLAFVVSKFSYVESPAELSATKFRIWARNDAINQTSYASTIGPKVLTIFEKWFNIPFPLPKQDMVALPDFSAGAMENWGLITYRETALLFDEKESSFMSKERVAEVIAHELAHQWFGNLVTMKWWSDLWLNEGFATFVANIGVRGVQPEWKPEQSDAVSSYASVLALDALTTSHPVSVPIDDPNRISEIFDEISYRKGSYLIRMMTNFLGEDVFRKAINKYLIKYSYQNAEQDDLWWELTEVTRQYNVLTRNVTVKEIMDTWTTQTGYPILTVKRDYDGNTLGVTQKRYLSLGMKASTETSWWVPLNVLCEKEAQEQQSAPVQWLSDKEGVTEEQHYEHGSKKNEWVLFNANLFALCRVNYDKRNWDLLIKTLNDGEFSNIPELSRVQLLSDSFDLAWSNVIEYDTPLRLINYLHREKEYLPLSIGLSALSKIENVIDRLPEYGAYQKFVRKLITNIYETSGGLYERTIINGEDLFSVKTQVLISRWACKMKVPGCEDNAVAMFKEWMEVDNPDAENPIPLDLRGTVYCVAISRGSVSEWRFLLQRYRNANVASAKSTAMLALACTKEVWILNQYLEWCIGSGAEVRRQDAGAVMSAIARGTVGYYVAKDFVYKRIQDIYKTFNGQGRRLGLIVKTIVSQFTSQDDLDEFLEWKEMNKEYLDEAKLAVAQAIEKAQVNIGWLTKNKNVVVNKIREFSQ